MLAGLVRHVDENPFTTLLAATRESVTHKLHCVAADLDAERRLVYGSSGTALDDLAPPATGPDAAVARDVVRRRLGLLMWRNWDKFASRCAPSSPLLAFPSPPLPSPRAGATAAG